MAQSTAAPLMGFSNAAALNALGLGQPTNSVIQGGDDPGSFPTQYLASLLAQQNGGGQGTAPTTPATPTTPANPSIPSSLLQGSPNMSGTMPPGGGQVPQGGGGTGSLLNGGGQQGSFGAPIPSGGTPYQAPDTRWGFSGDRLMRFTPQNGPVDPGLLPNNPFPGGGSGGGGGTGGGGGGGGGGSWGSGDVKFGPIVPPEKNPQTYAGAGVKPFDYNTGANRDLPVTGKSAPQLSGFTDAQLYRNIGNNPQLTVDLVARDGYDKYHQLVNKYNEGSGYASQGDFTANHDADMAAGKAIAAKYGLPDPTQGLTSIEDMKKLGLWPS